MLSDLENGEERSHLQYRAAECGAHHPRRGNLIAAVQADPGLRRRAERLTGGLAYEPGTALTLFTWNQHSPGKRPALYAVSTDDLTFRIHTVKNIQPWLAYEHANCSWFSNSCQRAAALLRRQGLRSPLSELSSSGASCRDFSILLTAGRLTKDATEPSKTFISSLFPWLIE